VTIRLLPSLTAAVSVAILALLSFTTSNVLGVVGSQSRYPEAMADYVLPAIGGAISIWLTPLIVVAIVVFACFWLILPLKPESRTRAVVGKAIATSLIVTLVVGIVSFVRIGLENGGGSGARRLASSLVAAGSITGEIFLVCAPLIVLGAVFTWVWYRRQGLTGNPAIG
jgi:amino acid transporter